VTALPDGTVIGYHRSWTTPSLFPRFLRAGGVGGPRRRPRWEQDSDGGRLSPQQPSSLLDLGYDPVTVDISEFQKLEGCVTCLSVRLRELSGIES
jgi:dimethylargininase